VQVWRLFATLAERSESGRGMYTAEPTLHRVCYAVEPELVEGITDCLQWRTGTTCVFTPLWVRHSIAHNAALCKCGERVEFVPMELVGAVTASVTGASGTGAGGVARILLEPCDDIWWLQYIHSLQLSRSLSEHPKVDRCLHNPTWGAMPLHSDLGHGKRETEASKIFRNFGSMWIGVGPNATLCPLHPPDSNTHQIPLLACKLIHFYNCLHSPWWNSVSLDHFLMQNQHIHSH